MIKNILAANGAKSNNEFLDINTMNENKKNTFHLDFRISHCIIIVKTNSFRIWKRNTN